jgi:uncharacterized protein Yka (UPF0111/DUF47 family)
MFDFVWKTKNSFKKVKKDIKEFRENANEWIVFLDGKGNKMEKKLDRIESRIDRIEESMFRMISLRK